MKGTPFGTIQLGIGDGYQGKGVMALNDDYSLYNSFGGNGKRKSQRVSGDANSFRFLFSPEKLGKGGCFGARIRCVSLEDAWIRGAVNSKTLLLGIAPQVIPPSPNACYITTWPSQDEPGIREHSADRHVACVPCS